MVAYANSQLGRWQLDSEPDIEDLKPPKANPELEAKYKSLLVAVGQAAVRAAQSGSEEFFFLSYYISLVLEQGYNLLCQLHDDPEAEADD